MKKLIQQIAVILFLFSFFGCSNKSVDNEINVNFDHLKLWNKFDNRLMFSDFAKTGRYIAFVDSANLYSIGIEGKLSELNAKPYEKIIVTGSMRTKNILATGGFVADVQNEKGESVLYNLANVAELVKKPNEWVDFKIEIDLKKQKLNKPLNYFKGYGWSMNGEAIYFDDIAFKFE